MNLNELCKFHFQIVKNFSEYLNAQMQNSLPGCLKGKETCGQASNCFIRTNDVNTALSTMFLVDFVNLLDLNMMISSIILQECRMQDTFWKRIFTEWIIFNGCSTFRSYTKGACG